MFLLQTSTLPSSMHSKLAELHGRCCMHKGKKKNQLPTTSHVESEDNIKMSGYFTHHVDYVPEYHWKRSHKQATSVDQPHSIQQVKQDVDDELD